MKRILFIVIIMIPLGICSQDKKLLREANRGNREKQVELANYYLGRGAVGDKEQAVEWYRRAADKNDRAQFFMGYCYENGIGVVKDSLLAIHWYEIAIANNNIEAQSALYKLQNKNLTNNSKKKEIIEIEQQRQIISEKGQQSHLSDVDTNIPITKTNNETTFVVIFANEDYQEEVKVDYALNDGEVFKQYCHKSLGVPETNIHIRKNATLNNMRMEMDWIKKVAHAYDGLAQIIVYYAGHGIPDEKTGAGYLLPIDGAGSSVATGYSLTNLYNFLGELPAKSVIVFIDACFSGSKRGEGMLASARGVAIKAKAQAPKGKMIVLSAAQGDETAYPYKEKQHGLFTYFLLKKLKETKGEVSLKELSDYLTTQVKRKSIVENGKSQTPSVGVSTDIQNIWQGMKLK